MAGLVAGLIGLAAAAFATLHSPLLAARRVTVVGALHTTRAEVLAVSGLGRRPPLIDVSSAADEAAIEALPWVAKAKVAREWPDAVSVVITERHPVVQIALTSGGYALADPTGRILGLSATRTAGLATVTGVAAVPPAGRRLDGDQLAAVDAAGALPVSLLGRTAWLREAGGDVVIQLVGGPKVLIGGATDLNAKMVSLATVLARVTLSGVVTIDLRVPGDPVLTS
jgi:cell division protein FtsQ